MTTHIEAFDAAFAQCPLIAILRGVKPDEVEARISVQNFVEADAPYLEKNANK